MIRNIHDPRPVHAQRGGVAIIMLLAFIVLAVPLAIAALETSTQLARSSGVYDRRLTGQYNAASGIEVAIYDALYGQGLDDDLSPSDPTTDIQVEVNGENVAVTVTKSYPSGYSDPTPFTPSSAIQVTKSVTPQSVVPNTPTDYTYTISLENTGATPLDITAITDELPLGLTYKGPTSGISIKDPTTKMVAGRQLLRWEVEEGFTWLTQSDDISVTTSGSWQDIDLTSYVPSTADGVIVELINTDNSTHRAFVRGKEDTRDYMDGNQDGRLRNRTHRWQMVKLDSNKTIQGYVNDTTVRFKLLGYTTGDDPDYFTVPPDVTPATTSAWTTVDVSSHVDADAGGVILLVYSESEQDREYAIREVGSSDTYDEVGLRRYQSTMHVVGLNASKEFEAWIEHSSLRLYLVAQTKGRFTYYVDDIVVADPSLGSWQTMDADDYAIPAAAGGLIMSVESDDYGIMTFRHGGGFDNWGPLSTNVDSDMLVQAPVGLNLANEWDEYMGIAKMDVAIAAWVKGNVTTVAPGDTLTLSFVATGILLGGGYTNQAAAEMRTLGCRASGLAALIDVGGGINDPAKVIRVDKVVTPDLGVGFDIERYTYTITVTNISGGPSVSIVDGHDLLPRFFDYLAGSTLVNNFPASDPIIALDPDSDPANDRQTLSWNLNENLAGGDSLTLEFGATASVDAGEYYNEGWITTDDSYFPCVSSGRAGRVTVSNVIDVRATASDGEVRTRVHWWKPQQRADIVSWQQ